MKKITMKKIIPIIKNVLWMIILVLIIFAIIYNSPKVEKLLFILLILHNFLSAIWNVVEWKINKNNKYIYFAIFDVIILLNAVLYLSNYYSIRALLRSRNIQCSL